MNARDVMALINPHINRLLTVAEAALPRNQFAAYRKVVLDEFGQAGFEGELNDLFYRSR